MDKLLAMIVDNRPITSQPFNHREVNAFISEKIHEAVPLVG